MRITVNNFNHRISLISFSSDFVLSFSTFSSQFGPHTFSVHSSWLKMTFSQHTPKIILRNLNTRLDLVRQTCPHSPCPCVDIWILSLVFRDIFFHVQNVCKSSFAYSTPKVLGHTSWEKSDYLTFEAMCMCSSNSKFY